MDRSQDSFDVVIVGAGPAGAVAGTLLSRAHLRVALVEQARFPREKVCGECLSALGVSVLRRNQLSSNVEALAIPLTRCRIFARSSTCAAVEIPLPMWGLSRGVLDGALLNEACRAGVILHQPVRVEQFASGTIPTVTVRDLTGNRIFHLQGKILVLADGKAAMRQREVAPTGSLGVKCHFADVEGEANCIDLFGVNGSYVGLAPIEANRWNMAFTVPVRRVAGLHGDLDALLAAMQRENQALAGALRRARQVSPWHTCPLPRFGVAEEWEENVIPLGNAAAAIEPIGGEGMGLAMASAELAVSEIIAAFRENRAVHAERIRVGFKRLWNRRRLGCRIAGMALSSPRVAPSAVRFLDDFPAFGASLARLVGK